MEAVYFCIMEGVDPETKNEKDYNKNAFYYACSKNHIDMLQMLVECFQVKYDKELELKFVPNLFMDEYDEGISIETMPLQIACRSKYYEIVKFLLKKYPRILDLNNRATKNFFKDVCAKRNISIMKILLDSNPNIFFLKSKYNSIIVNRFFAKCNLDDAKKLID